MGVIHILEGLQNLIVHAEFEEMVADVTHYIVNDGAVSGRLILRWSERGISVQNISY